MLMKRPPHILLIMSDQQRWDSLGCYGAHWVSTPHLDRLAAQGTRFENCYVLARIEVVELAKLLECCIHGGVPCWLPNREDQLAFHT